MDEDDALREALGRIEAMQTQLLGLIVGLLEELAPYREMLPEPGTIKARLLSRKAGRMAAANAVDQWNGG